MRNQRTINKEVSFAGIGVFSAKKATVTFKPAEPDTGVVFIRTDLSARPRVRAAVYNIVSRPHRSSLSEGNVEVQMVEHLLACFAGLGIDNLEVEIDGPEVPAGDGSAAPILARLKKAGIKEQELPKKCFRIAAPITVTEGNAGLMALPASRASEPGEDSLTISYTLDYGNPTIKIQSLVYQMDPESFAEEIAPARTFLPEYQIEEFRRLGLGKGATYKNTLVVTEEGIIDNELRFPDEFVRHKVLDLIGDLFLLGAELSGHIVAARSGHTANAKFVKKIVETMAKTEAFAKDFHLEIGEIQRILPHRYPFLLIDKVIEIQGQRRAVGIKNVTFNEPFFQGHFPGRPIMPGVLQIEAMAQLAGVLLLRKLENTNKLALILSIDKVKLRKPVVPGDQLLIEAEAVKVKSRTGQVNTTASVDGKRVAEAEIRFMLVDVGTE